MFGKENEFVYKQTVQRKLLGGVCALIGNPMRRVKAKLSGDDSFEEDLQHHWDYLYEPDAKELLDGLLERYIESQVYQAVVENNACEQASRMIAMKSATDNAGDLIDGLQLVYNKARQAAITQELSEIVSGAAAV